MGDDLNSLKTKLSDLENRLSFVEKELRQAKGDQDTPLKWTYKFIITAFALAFFLFFVAPQLFYYLVFLFRG